MQPVKRDVTTSRFDMLSVEGAILDGYMPTLRIELGNTPAGGWRDDSRNQNYYFRGHASIAILCLAFRLSWWQPLNGGKYRNQADSLRTAPDASLPQRSVPLPKFRCSGELIGVRLAN